MPYDLNERDGIGIQLNAKKETVMIDSLGIRSSTASLSNNGGRTKRG
jgi:hypothetical protein